MTTVTFMFLGSHKLALERKNSYTSSETIVQVMHMHLMFFAVFKNLKSSFLEDNRPELALDIFIENATKMI